MATLTVKGGTVQLTGNPCRVEISGAAPVNGTDHKLLLKLEGPNLKGSPLIDAIQPKNGAALFDVSGYVNQPVPAIFDFPLTGAVKAYGSQALQVTFTPGASYIDPDGILQENWDSPVTGYQFLKGGLSPRQFKIYEKDNKNFFTEYIQSKRFLTQRPWGDFVHPAQPVKLFFMTDKNISTTLNITAVYHDRTQETRSTGVSMNPDGLYEFNVNPVYNGIPAVNAEGSKIYFFDVQLGSGGGAASESWRFHMDNNHNEKPVFVLFANSLGGVDDYYLAGDVIDGGRFEGTTAYKPQQESDGKYEPTIHVSSRRGFNRWTIYTGWKLPASLRYLRDLLVTKQAWLLYPNQALTNFAVIPVLVKTDDTDLSSKMDPVKGWPIDFEEGHSTEFSFDNAAF